MTVLHKRIKAIFSTARKHCWLHYMLAGILFLLLAFYYMGPSAAQCSTTVYGFGDNTAGPIWRHTVSPNSPLWGFEKVTNYPVGESLYSPVHYSAVIQYTAYWISAKIAGPVCGYNLVNFLGFASSALVMYGFIYAITRRRWVSLLAGYAVSFAPYYQMKIGGHPSYGYQALLIGVAWVFYNLIKYQRKKDAIQLGIITAVCFYFDPYFSLLAAVLLGSLFLTWLGVSWWRSRIQPKVKTYIQRCVRLFLISLTVFAFLLLPLLAATISAGKEISATVAASRGNVLAETRACSNFPYEYFAPFVLHPVFGKLVGEQRYRAVIDAVHDGFTCGIGEDTVGISLAVLLIVIMGLTVVFWEKLNKRKLAVQYGFDTRLLIVGFTVLGLVVMFMALPPARLLGIIPSPAYILLKITTTWRTLTRFYVLENFAAVTLFAMFLSLFSHTLKTRRWLLRTLFCLLFLFIFVEYQAFKPFSGNQLSTFNYQKDIPAPYLWLKDQPNIKVIAEYPLERAGGESNAEAYYLSMQSTHKKNMFNANSPTTKEEVLRGALKDLSDRQTIDVLYSTGIDTVVVHGVEESELRKIPGLEVIYSAPQSAFNILAYTPLVKKDNVVIAKVKGSQIASMLALGNGFVRNTNIIKSSIDWEYEATDKSEIDIAPLPGRKDLPVAATQYCFAVRISNDGGAADLTLTVDGATASPFPLTSSYQQVTVLAKNKIVLTNSSGFNMRVKDLGCE